MYHLVCSECSQINRVPVERLPDDPKCGRCGARLLAPEPVELDAALLRKMITKSDLPIAVDFWAPWCGPCKMMAPAFTAAARDFHPSLNRALEPAKAVLFAKLNTEDHPDPARSFGIRGIPTTIVFKHGRELGRQSGAMDTTMIRNWIKGQTGAQ